jgi:hypothetical protein
MGLPPLSTLRLLKGGLGREATAAARLYGELLADAIATLPPEVTRLVIVADSAPQGR